MRGNPQLIAVFWRVALRESTEAFGNYVSSTPGFLAVNEAAIRRYGYTREEFLAMSHDTRPGIPDHFVEQLCYGFPPEGAPLRFSSAGLGLAIVRTLVEAMGSTLQVDTDSEGTHFSFVLELAPTV